MAAPTAELSDLPPARQNLQGVREKAHRRRQRTVASVIAAFLATATAAVAAVLGVPHAEPPALYPELIGPYGGYPTMALTTVVDRRAIMIWQDRGGRSRVVAIDLATGKQPWPPVELGTFDEGFLWAGAFDGVMSFAGITFSPGSFTLLGLELRTGRVVWRRPAQRDGKLLGMGTALPGARPGPAVMVVAGESEVTGVDLRNGRDAWKIPALSDDYALQHGNRFAQLQKGGLLRVVDVGTGRVVAERSGLPDPLPAAPVVRGDRLYFSDNNRLWRMPITGNAAPVAVTDGKEVRVRSCDGLVCARGRGFVAAFHPATGKQLWRREVSDSDDLAAGGFGFIVEAGGRTMVLAPNGRDITPPGLGDRRVYWTHDGNLILQRDLEKVVITAAMVEDPPQNAEVSVYSLATRKERPLGQHYLYGNCTGLPGKYVCAGKDGFVLIH